MTSNAEEANCNLENVYKCLKNGLVASDDVDMACYIDAYKELYNFFLVLGSAFHFVASDVNTKIKILEDHKNNAGDTKNFDTVKSMMEHEMKNNMLGNSKYVSGSRTLLRLHRGLDFVRQFLGAVQPLEGSVGVGGVCRESYDNTLANFHPFPIKAAARLAMKLLPTKQNLMAKMTYNDAAVAERLQTVLPEMLKIMGDVYARVDALYTANDLHNLK